MGVAPRVAVIDYGSGNLRSVAKALERSGLAPDVTCDPAAVRCADAVVLPGVGAFADAAARLRAKRIDEALVDSVAARRPYLGICLGLQLLFAESEEHGLHSGFGLLRGRVERFPEASDGRTLRVPHIGWNEVCFEGDHPMLQALRPSDCFYFVHSYRAVPARRDNVVGWTEYGGAFAAAVATQQLFAVQFHPEKSQSAGQRLLDAFANWVRQCR
jgi:glutamine amidotransferase